MIPSKRAIEVVCNVTNLDNDLAEFLVDELITTENLSVVLQDEEKMASLLGEHLVKFVYFRGFLRIRKIYY